MNSYSTKIHSRTHPTLQYRTVLPRLERTCTIKLTRFPLIVSIKGTHYKRQYGMNAHYHTIVVGMWSCYSGRRPNRGERSKRGSTVFALECWYIIHPRKSLRILDCQVVPLMYVIEGLVRLKRQLCSKALQAPSLREEVSWSRLPCPIVQSNP